MRLTATHLAVLLAMVLSAQAQDRLVSRAEYSRYIDALLATNDFGMYYYDDGAADASVVFPSSEKEQYGAPRPAVLSIIHLRARGLPVLIDCLTDGRLSTVRFAGNTTTKEMLVPVGYICLDILMAVSRGKPASDPDCTSDGLGACMNQDFYFRPDDYVHCRKSECDIRPQVALAQKTWRKQFALKRLHFRDPYRGVGIPEYEKFATRP